MAHFVTLALRGLLLLCTIKCLTNAIEVSGHLPDISVINNFIDNFVKPYLRTIFAERHKPIYRATGHETKHTGGKETVEAVIEQKIAELRPLLQDGDDGVGSADNLAIEDKDDQTTILEFLPQIGRAYGGGEFVKPNMKPDAFQTNIKKYKKMRGKIEKMLHKENINIDTRDNVINTLDDIITQLIENQCTWKTVDRPTFRHHRMNELISKVRSLSDDQWSELRRQYEGFLQKKVVQEGQFLDMFHEFFSKVVNGTQLSSKKYKIRCKLIEIDKEKQQKPRYKTVGVSNTNSCKNFKVCSEELKELMIEFYKHLNDTTVSAYKNYAAMYIRDVNMDVDVDKDTVVSIINNIGDAAEQKVAKLFKKHTKMFKLDENKDSKANIKHLTEYIKSTSEHIKKNLKKRTDTELSTLRAKLYLSIKEDLDVNIDVDLGNSERLYIDTICSRFVICNGRYTINRRADKINPTLENNNNVYVKIKVNFEDEMRNGVAQVRSKLTNYAVENNANINRGAFRRNAFKEMYNNKLTVSRTTMAVTTTSATVDIHINEV